MSVWRLIKTLNWKQVTSLARLFAARPLMLYPTARATVKCMAICNRLYPGKHQGNGPENAFRHALWNIAIARESMKWNKNDTHKALEWAKTITEWHEDFAPNPPLQHAMDMHNNATGRYLFTCWLEEGKAPGYRYITERLQACSRNSIAIRMPGDTEKAGNRLVHIENTER
ncbi:DUF6973 domain-containing protein [Sinomicrobium soli]|uniref:DUF6973 domain-containing protein n=1 Tax=Sinomicrobium sp. N-1-3-6 TaxID=2219864 RepID=UPI000DCE678A|nr:hypothetical protein [Sinomicrobium sp. N-1-3-6]RAV28340.1 hypothetical protein DN748_14400 [Sinomicrobium sp. N-1-3-6]